MRTDSLFKNKKFQSFILIVLSFLALIFIISNSKKYSLVNPYEKTFLSMGTVVRLKFYGPDAKKAFIDSKELIDKLSNIFSANDDTSETYILNRLESVNDVQISPEFGYVLACALLYSKMTNGLFDVTIRPLIELWGIGTSDAKIPKKDEIEYALKKVGYENIKLSGDKLSFTRKGMSLDFGAIAKGYIADKITELTKGLDLTASVIDIGGNIVVNGHNPDSTTGSFRVAIDDPFKTNDEGIGTLDVNNCSVVTSGDYQRYFDVDGIRYHHILDPYTGYPSKSDIKSVTIVADKSIDADALSTSVFLLGRENGPLLAKARSVGCIVVFENRTVYVSPNIKDLFNLNTNEFVIVDDF